MSNENRKLAKQERERRRQARLRQHWVRQCDELEERIQRLEKLLGL